MKLSQVLGTIKGADGEKTASAAASPTPTTDKSGAVTGDRLRVALQEATASVGGSTEKKASTTPIGDLTKLANDTALAEHESLVKEAQLYGAAVADGFMARLSQYNEAAEKTAAAAVVPRNLEKQAADLGFATTMSQMDKLASAAYESGYNDTVAKIYTAAHDCFVEGYKHASELIVEAR